MSEILNEQLRTGFELTLELGLAAADFSIEETDVMCPTHAVTLIDERARDMYGWKQATTCPASDGTCAFDVTSDIIACAGPELYEGREQQVETINVVLEG